MKIKEKSGYFTARLTGYKQRVLDAHSHLHSLHHVMEVSHPEEQGAHEYGSGRGEALQE